MKINLPGSKAKSSTPRLSKVVETKLVTQSQPAAVATGTAVANTPPPSANKAEVDEQLDRMEQELLQYAAQRGI